MTDGRFLIKTNSLLLAFSILFGVGLWTIRRAEKPVETAPGYTVTTAKNVGAAAPGESAAALIVNVNTASEEELQALPGIGPVKARAIVEHREKNGNFTCAEDLLKVSGIGEATLEGIRNDITWEVTP